MFQLAALKMSLVGVHVAKFAPADTDASLAECALNTEVSILAFARTVLIQRASYMYIH